MSHLKQNLGKSTISTSTKLCTHCVQMQVSSTKGADLAGLDLMKYIDGCYHKILY
uniref:Uncharacterized protein n=1 Tax=Rhizophora mucronata TaxID=61149 RepID=A0A2P2NV09_RHIMU